MIPYGPIEHNTSERGHQEHAIILVKAGDVPTSIPQAAAVAVTPRSIHSRLSIGADQSYTRRDKL